MKNTNIFLTKNVSYLTDIDDIMYFEGDCVKMPPKYTFLESEIVYFSAGDSKIKEILIKKDPASSI